MDLIEAKEFNQRLESILPEVELLTGSIDHKVKELAKEYLANPESDDLLIQCRQLIMINQVLSIVATFIPNHPDNKGKLLESYIKDIFKSDKAEIYKNSKSYEYLTMVHMISMFYCFKDALMDEGYYPPLTKDSHDALQKVINHYQNNRISVNDIYTDVKLMDKEVAKKFHNHNIFLAARRYFQSMICATTIEVMELLAMSSDPNQYTQEQIFCQYINTLLRNINFGSEYGDDLLSKTDFQIDLSIGQLKQSISFIRRTLHSNNIID